MLQYLIGLLFAAIILVLLRFAPTIKRSPHKATAKSCLQRKEIVYHDNPMNAKTASLSPSPLFDFIQVRHIYHSLHHLEAYPDVLPVAKEILLSSLEAAECFGKSNSTNNGIHSIERYTSQTLCDWVDESDAKIMKEFEQYSLRRANGGRRELLQDRDIATRWLRAQAPLRFVDGAWLGHISRVDTSWKHADVIRQLWQILSEELGDGDVEKHHTRLYAQLLQALSPDTPEAHSLEFLEGRHGASDESVWRSAVMQLIISLFHQDFLPEILGFNLHFERITLGMLQAMTELQELGIDATYFMLHVCIDNAATGHTAVALKAVVAYLDSVKEHKGVSAEQQAWRRIQAGYTLSEGDWMTQAQDKAKSTEELQRSVATMFKSKARAGSGAHHMCKGKIKGRRVVDWLDMSQIGNAAWWQSLTQSLSTSRAWVLPGNSGQSHFLKEISWGGRMFGAFTDTEASTLREWIDQMPHGATKPQVRNSESDHMWQLHSGAHNGLAPYVSLATSASTLEQCRAKVLAAEPKGVPQDLLYDMDISTLLHTKCLPAVWYAQFCLLEKFITLPSRCGHPLGGLILRILRAQDGFFPDECDMAGDNMRMQTTHSLIQDVGHQLLQCQGLPLPASLAGLLSDQCCGELPEVISCISAAPLACQGMLVGMAAGFVSLHNAMAACSGLALRSRGQLRRLVSVEQTELKSALPMLDCDAKMEFARGFEFVRQQLGTLFPNRP